MSEVKELITIAHEFAAADHRRTADDLEALRDRLGQDGLSQSEWNALISAISFFRVEAFRRDRAANGEA